MKYKAFLIGFFILLLGFPTQAQTPRQLVFRNLDAFFINEPEVEINLSGRLLDLAARIPNEDANTRRMLQNLKGVYVRTYSLRSTNRTDVMDKIEELTYLLEDNKWEVMAKARENDRFSEIMIYPLADETIGGMFVFALDADDEEFTIVNLEGNIDPDDLSDLGARFGVDALNNLRKNEFVELPCRGEDQYSEACMRQSEAIQLQNDARRLQDELQRNEAEENRRVREGVAQEQEQLRNQIREMQGNARAKQEEARRLYDANSPRNRDQNARRATPLTPSVTPPTPATPPVEENKTPRTRDGK